MNSWLPDMDLNHDKQIQSLLCYRYTIGQTGPSKVESWASESRLRRMEEWNRGMMECWIGREIHHFDSAQPS